MAASGGLIVVMRDARDVTSSGGRGFFGREPTALAIYGTMAAGLALAIGIDTDLGTWALIAAIVAELVGFFIAHVYADMLGEHVASPKTRLPERLRHAFSRDVLLLVGGLPILIVFAVERAAGLDANLAANVVLAILIVLMGILAIAAARRAPASWSVAVGEGLLAVLVGTGVLVLKLLLH